MSKPLSFFFCPQSIFGYTLVDINIHVHNHICSGANGGGIKSLKGDKISLQNFLLVTFASRQVTIDINIHVHDHICSG